MSNNQSNANPFHPEVFRSHIQKKAPSKHEAATAILRIIQTDLFNCDWSIYAGLNGSGIKGKVTLEITVEDDDLNGATFDEVIKFLEAHTITYHKEPDNSLELAGKLERHQEDEFQRQQYYLGNG